MRHLIVIFSFIVTLLACNSENKHSADHGRDKDKSTSASSKKSIPSETKKSIANTEIKINYHAPAVRGRVIWGGLVPYDSVWVTGAHQATSLEVGKDFEIGSTTIPAGKYALFTIPGKENWTIIINKNWKQHLADDYQQSEDVTRIIVKPETTSEVTERLKYEIDQAGEKTANIVISWEKVRVPFLLTIK